jgi:hypothetical protein
VSDRGKFEDHRDQWHPWFVAATELPGRQWTEVRRGSPQDEDWKRYFEQTGWMPAVVRDGQQKAYTMPVPWPSMLPGRFPGRRT